MASRLEDGDAEAHCAAVWVQIILSYRWPNGICYMFIHCQMLSEKNDNLQRTFLRGLSQSSMAWWKIPQAACWAPAHFAWKDESFSLPRCVTSSAKQKHLATWRINWQSQFWYVADFFCVHYYEFTANLSSRSKEVIIYLSTVFFHPCSQPYPSLCSSFPIHMYLIIQLFLKDFAFCF